MLGVLNNFDRNHILLKLKIKKLSQNINSKNIKTGVYRKYFRKFLPSGTEFKVKENVCIKINLKNKIKILKVRFVSKQCRA